MSFHSYRGQASTRPQQTGATWSQARTRHGQNAFDQHGRQWSFSADNRNGMPTSIISPDGWSAPWYPDQQYLRINPDNTTELYIDYPGMYAPRKAAIAGYHKEAVRYAQRKSMPIPKKGGPYSVEITEAIGEPPRAIELIAAAAQEHPWVLGRSNAPDPRLVQFLETTSADLEAELDDFDFSPESYNEAITGKQPATRRTAAPAPQPKPQKFKSLAELEAAAGEIVDEVEDPDEIAEREEMERAARENALEQLQGTGATAGDEELEALGIEDDVDAPPPPVRDELDDLLDIDEQHDPEARGGQRVHPKKQAHAAKQASRRPGSTSVNRKHGAARSAGTSAAPEKPKASKGGKAWDAEAAKGRTLADGAKPYTGS